MAHLVLAFRRKSAWLRGTQGLFSLLSRSSLSLLVRALCCLRTTCTVVTPSLEPLSNLTLRITSCINYLGVWLNEHLDYLTSVNGYVGKVQRYQVVISYMCLMCLTEDLTSLFGDCFLQLTTFPEQILKGPFSHSPVYNRSGWSNHLLPGCVHSSRSCLPHLLPK